MHNIQPSALPLLTEEIAINAIRDFFRGKPFVIFGTGMSCALDVRFGMPALSTTTFWYIKIPVAFREIYCRGLKSKIPPTNMMMATEKDFGVLIIC